MPIYIIHGPAGCGKTLNIPAFEKYLGVPYIRDLDLTPSKAADWVSALGKTDGFILTNLPEVDLTDLKHVVRSVMPYKNVIDACLHANIPVDIPVLSCAKPKRTLGHIGEAIPEAASTPAPFTPYSVLDRMELAAWLNARADKIGQAMDAVLFETKGNVAYLRNVIEGYRAEAKRLLDIPAEE